jgi:DNA replication protein DnaC
MREIEQLAATIENTGPPAGDVEAEWRQAQLSRWTERLKGNIPSRHLAETVPLMPQCNQFLSTGIGDMICGMYLHGPVGTGKTSQLVQMMKQIFANHAQTMNADPCGWGFPALDERNPPRALYVTESSMLEMMRPGEGQCSPDKFKRVTWLLIDEVGRAKSTEWSSEQLYGIIDHRYSEMMPTVWASNLSIRELAQAKNANYDDRVIRRIFDMCGGVKAQAEKRFNSFELNVNYSRRGAV